MSPRHAVTNVRGQYSRVLAELFRSNLVEPVWDDPEPRRRVPVEPPYRRTASRRTGLLMLGYPDRIPAM